MRKNVGTRWKNERPLFFSWVFHVKSTPMKKKKTPKKTKQNQGLHLSFVLAELCFEMSQSFSFYVQSICSLSNSRGLKNILLNNEMFGGQPDRMIIMYTYPQISHCWYRLHEGRILVCFIQTIYPSPRQCMTYRRHLIEIYIINISIVKNHLQMLSIII